MGFTTLSEQEDAEEIRDLLSRYFEVARGVIEGYGGSVEKFIGDAVMAVWGAPVAQEDDPERAVRAGLDLVERVRGLKLGDRALDVRVGILSGEAAVTPGRVGEGMVAGDIVNTASRLQSVAPGGVVLVGEATQRATSAAVAYEPAGEQLLKGKQAPVDAWRALRVVARVGGAGREEGLEPPFVGREEELRLLKEHLHTSERARRLHVVTVVGQPGVGKSRLAWELEKYLDGLAGPMLYYWHQGRSPAYGEGVTYWALGEMVRRRAGIAEGEGADETRQKLRDTLATFMPDDEERRWIEPALGALLGIDEADWRDREQLFSAWQIFFERIADRGPTVLVFEDLQWADTGLLDFIDHLFERSRERPIFVVTLARPEFLDRRPNFGIGRHAYAALHLEPLSDEAMAELLERLVPNLGAADLGRIIERAEGVPLYAVETVRSLLDSGHLVRAGDTYAINGTLPVLDIPPTLRALIASRLDALDGADRALVQDASVSGQVFASAALSALSGHGLNDVEARLHVLSARELVALETDPRSPERGQYRFTQGLIREVAYGTLSKRERRAKHVAAARFFEQVGDDELAAVFANHYLEAYQAAPEGDEGSAVAAQARVALRAAAERASRLHSHAQAMAFYDQAMSVTFDEADLVDLRERSADSAAAVGDLDRALERLREVIVWHESRADPQATARAISHLGIYLLQGSRIDEAGELFDRAIDMLPDKNSREASEIYGQQARVELFRDRAEPGLTAIERALEISEAYGDRELLLQQLITKGWALGVSRKPIESFAVTLGALALAREDGNLLAQSRALFNLSGQLAIDDPRLGLRLGHEGMELDERHGLLLRAANFAGNVASASLCLGDFEEVLRLSDRVAWINNPVAGAVHGYAAVAHAFRGEFEKVAEKFDFMRRGVVGSSSAQDLSPITHQEALISLANGDVAAALQKARDCRDAYYGADGPFAAVLAARCSLLRADITGARDDLVYLSENRILGAWLDRARRETEAGILALEGSSSEAREAYRDVIEEQRAQDARWDLAWTLLHRSVTLGGADPHATAGREEAGSIFASVGAGGLMDRLQATLAGNGDVTAAAGASGRAISEGAAAARR